MNNIDDAEKPKKILVVEDENVLQALIQRVLGNKRYLLTIAATLREGLEHLQSAHFDMLLTDLRLPDGNGIEMIPLFKTKYPSANVVVITGSLSPEERLAQIPAGNVKTCLLKPFTLESLHEAVREALRDAT